MTLPSDEDGKEPPDKKRGGQAPLACPAGPRGQHQVTDTLGLQAAPHSPPAPSRCSVGKGPTLRGLPTWWVSSSFPPQAGRTPGGLFSACHMATSTLPCNHLPEVGLKWWEWVPATSAACRGKGDTEAGPGITVRGACPVLPTWACRWTPSGCRTAPFPCSHLGSWTPCPSESTDPGQTARSHLRSSGSKGQRKRGEGPVLSRH